MKKECSAKLIFAVGILCLSFTSFACTSNRNETNATQSADSKASESQAHDRMNTQTDELNDEKAKLEREKEKLAQDQAKLNKEKKEVENAKNATPPDVDTENWSGRDWTVPKPPSNIRTAPDGEILCTVKEKTQINLRGTSNVKDNNGEWLYTDYCGKIGFIHSSQIQFIDGEPAGE